MGFVNRVVNFIDDIYHSINVTQTFIVYSKYTEDIYLIKNRLEKQDYPICLLKEKNDYNELRYRVFIINNKLLESLIDLNKILVVICLDKESKEKINNLMIDKKNVEKLYIFSCIN